MGRAKRIIAFNPKLTRGGKLQKWCLFAFKDTVQCFIKSTFEYDEGTVLMRHTRLHRFRNPERFIDSLSVFGGNPIPYIVVIGTNAKSRD
ncbi:MAG: hypothetical protein A2552_08235 [Sulfuricurvum sp. RIFOXYD2_FULL_44_160]|uniref:Uncharacterized protein n=1 Tax=Sulfuricurvum kujiense TaxID=148813 RepID=A0A2D3WCY3_9BACT|nr:MAG: hypothetical protein A2517_10630 [Sulfuricurvum sp. RIFOXYD12_FULL_44_77]OHD92839.1 MAG: hypothetical protein A2552_08235 [Sulfuricurvum sp. RIFOXYD2_FULL_44_160]DAB39172.1 MAG TPA: hypothetical protein CFH83_02125 [Sulfuricurvum kujiense]